MLDKKLFCVQKHMDSKLSIWYLFFISFLIQVTTNLQDPEVLRRECLQGVAMGYTGKQTIHPSQVETVHEIFSPPLENVQHAIALYEHYFQEGKPGAFSFDGKMVDRPILRKAEKTLSLAVHYDIEKQAALAVLQKLGTDMKG
jgi:citrate lyase beta subunit